MNSNFSYQETSNKIRKTTVKLTVVGLAILALGTLFFLIGGFTPGGPSWAYAMVYASFGMMPFGFLLAILSLWGAIGCVIADSAASKGRSWQAFFWLTILCSPILMAIIAASVSPLPGSAAYVGPSATGTKPLDSTDQLRKLADLRDQGILTKAEFELKKKELLDRI